MIMLGEHLVEGVEMEWKWFWGCGGLLNLAPLVHLLRSQERPLSRGFHVRISLLMHLDASS